MKELITHMDLIANLKLIMESIYLIYNDTCNCIFTKGKGQIPQKIRDFSQPGNRGYANDT